MDYTLIIWNETRSRNLLICKRTLYYFAKPVEWLSSAERTLGLAPCICHVTHVFKNLLYEVARMSTNLLPGTCKIREILSNLDGTRNQQLFSS